MLHTASLLTGRIRLPATIFHRVAVITSIGDTGRVSERVRRHLRVEGVVQGVGFRPFVYNLATRLGLTGFVGNDVHGVFIEAEGSDETLVRFTDALTRQAPPLAVVDRVETSEIAACGEDGFEIVLSDSAGNRETLVSADSATCADCLSEMLDPDDRRFGYPFINCTNCGPRFTIVADVPYDRPSTTMAPFEMCADCAAEYHDPSNRRFHAQPVCCPACGPSLRLTNASRNSVSTDPLADAVRSLRRGEVLAVKGLGGYHLAVDACSTDAAATLRKRKHREEKPFALMVADLEQARELCVVGDSERALLESRQRPIVLLDRRANPRIAAAVAPGNRHLGLMLPYTPLHHLLLRNFGGPIVLTSANVSDEPIAYRDEEAFSRLSRIADSFLTHDRGIHLRTDDSVVRAFRERQMIVRRSRGYVPEPVPVEPEFARPVLACGAELKNTFCLGKQQRAFVSHHIGDLENFETLRSFTEGIEHFRRLFEVDPAVVVHDLHPEYLSTKYAKELDGVQLLGVQHHHAHIASCLADNGERGPVLGVAFDGLGFGLDETIWGGEFLLADLVDFRRLAHLAPTPMPGATTAIKQPWRMAVAQLAAYYGDDLPGDLEILQRNKQWPTVARMCARHVNAPMTSSAGRLFDSVAALLGVRDSITFEGQAAIELEQRADPREHGHYSLSLSGADIPHRSADPPGSIATSDLVRAVVDDLRAGTEVPVIAARFHNSVAELIARVCARSREATGVSDVALSGGVFQNMLLLDRTVEFLRQRDFRVLVHSRVPANDGGISLGQAVIAGARDRLHHG